MSQFTVPTRDQVSPATQTAFDGLQKMAGFVPNLFATFGHSEHALPRYLAFQGAKTSLSNKEKEAVNLIVSEVNGCRYCQSAHTAIGKMNGFSDEEILDIRAGQSANPKLNTLVVLAKDITENKGRAAAQNVAAFYEAGYTKGNLVDLILQVSDKIAANYLHNLTGVEIDWPLVAELEATAA
ncbi:carboxymuconolactone decarboxylase family protein [Fibrella arboris]|uniref:carboxymuconolactone decarboxylase family protein n=1 Tax=Fibrella arboris TaxID=3242486 RepID=UPI003522F217